jgi:predicted dehydrogenase
MSDALRRAGIVGCGRIAGTADTPSPTGPVRTHAQAYCRHPRFELVSAADPDEGARRRFASRWGVARTHASLEAMLAVEHLDVLSVCTPDEQHAEAVMCALESADRPGVIFLEKPAALDPGDLARMAEASCKVGTPIVVDHTRRFDVAHQRVARLVADGTLGALLSGTAEYYGGLVHNGCHLVDLVLMLFPSMNVTVGAAKRGAPGRPGDPCVDADLIVGDAKVRLLGFDESYYQLSECEFRFSRGRVRLEDFGTRIVVETVEVNDIGEKVLVPVPGTPWAGLDSPIFHAIELLADMLDGKVREASRGVLLDEATRVMDLVWEARRRAGIEGAST